MKETTSDPGSRFEIRRTLGSGGMGVVYEAYDVQRQQVVALKKLHRSDASGLYRLKHEFRSLADVAHPNLVPLYELIRDGHECFFTMELVDGVDFLSWVRPAGTNETKSDLTPTHSASLASRPTLEKATGPSDRSYVSPAARGVLRIEFLRRALRQLAEGVEALHEAGRLHRDLKPSNVLVRSDGRVVILDFGLVEDLQLLDGDHHVTFGGTPAYMSPEQMAELPMTAASDWYSVGVMLYEALTGRRPSIRSLFRLDERSDAFLPPIEIDPTIPRDLNDLCVALLALESAARPDGHEVLGRLGAARPFLPAPRLVRNRPFIGRELQAQQLWRAYDAVKAGTAAAALIHGPSGIGKTALVQHFIDELQEREPGTVVLRGRCYEQESVPYKALDSLVDDLFRYAKRLSRLEVQAMVPTNIDILVRLFPVLEPLQLSIRRRRPGVDVPDSQESRRRAFAALREMLTRLADTHPLVLFIDDLQWGDQDSALVLSELMGPPDPPPALILLAYRSEAAATTPLIQEMNRQRAGSSPAQLIDLPIGELSDDETLEFARSLGLSDERAAAIARASEGSPLFVNEIAHLALEVEEQETPLTVDDLIRARIERLPEGARRVLEIVAIAGQPMERSVVEKAAAVAGPDAMLTLRSHHLLRSRVVAGHEEVMTHHDRFREAIRASLDEGRRRELHRRLAAVLEEEGHLDPEMLATHLAAAGETERAAEQTVLAADRAAEALAFEHAARLYGFALGLHPEMPNVDPVRIRLANALANAGRGSDAAPLYLTAAQSAEPPAALELRRRAAENLLRGGHVDAGIRVVRDVLASVGLELPRTPRRALIGYLWRRILLRLRGWSSREKSAKQIDPAVLMKIDICWSVIIGLARIDNVRSAYFQPIHLRLALNAGEPFRVARALTVEAGFAGTRGGPGRQHALRILERAEKQVRHVEHPLGIGLVSLAASIAHFYVGLFGRSLESAEKADKIFRESCTGVTWEINTSQNYVLSSLAYLGDYGEIAKRIPVRLREAQERGDLYAATDPTGRAGIAWLAADQADVARHAIEEVMSQWSLIGFHFQHFIELQAHSQIDLYGDNAAQALARLEQRWPMLKASMLLRIQFNRIEALHLRARCAVAVAAVSGDRSLLRAVDRDADAIASERMSWSLPLAETLRAAVALQRGNAPAAVAALRRAISGFDKAQMAAHAGVARWRLARLIGGDEGRALSADAERWMQAAGVRRPEQFARVLAPALR